MFGLFIGIAILTAALTVVADADYKFTCSRTVRLASYELRIVSYMCVIIEIVSAARGLPGLNRGRLAGHESTVDLSTQAPIGACLPRRLPVFAACLS